MGNLPNFYESLDNKHKIYSRKEITTSNPALAYSGVSPKHVPDTGQEQRPETGFDLQREADQFVLARYGHRGLLVDDKMRILQFRGVMGRLLAPGSGEATLNLTAMLHEDLRIPVRVLIEKAGKQNQAVSKKNVPVKIDKILTRVSVEVIPITNRFDQQRFFLVLFEEEYPAHSQDQTDSG